MTDSGGKEPDWKELYERSRKTIRKLFFWGGLFIALGALATFLVWDTAREQKVDNESTRATIKSLQVAVENLQADIQKGRINRTAFQEETAKALCNYGKKLNDIADAIGADNTAPIDEERGKNESLQP